VPIEPLGGLEEPEELGDGPEPPPERREQACDRNLGLLLERGEPGARRLLLVVVVNVDVVVDG
jgi:hypothetical protein